MRKDYERAIDFIKNYKDKEIRMMEVCGTHTHEIFKLGIRDILPDNIKLISGPGCPVCVSDTTFIDQALFLGNEKNVTLGTFGDLVKVPGTKENLADLRAKGSKVNVFYSPLDAVEYAKNNPKEDVVFLAVGFETTTPSYCIAIQKAMQDNVKNFSILNACKTMPKAYEFIKDNTDIYIYPGHVHAIIGTKLCKEMADKNISGIITGFTLGEILSAFVNAIKLYDNKEKDKGFYKNCYTRVVTESGLINAQKMVDEMMIPSLAKWRGLGEIEDSGMDLREKYRDFDAKYKYDIPDMDSKNNKMCKCSDVLKGEIEPKSCPLFGQSCTPSHPIGSCMVSSEGACSAWYLYGGMK